MVRSKEQGRDAWYGARSRAVMHGTEHTLERSMQHVRHPVHL